jgi:heptosyltransferase-3
LTVDYRLHSVPLNVLLVRAGALGDILLLRGAVAGLRAAGHRVSLLAPSSSGAALVGPGPGEVDGLLPWESAPIASLLAPDGRVAPEVERALAPFAAVIAFTGNALLARGLGAAGARVVAHPPLPPKGGRHAAHWAAQAITAVGASAAIEPPVLAATPQEDTQARPWLDRLPTGFVAVHPGSGSARKNWPSDRFAAVLEALCPDRPWLLVEGPADAEAARSLSRLPGAVPARELPARVLGAVLARAGIVVGNDSGVTHLAAAFGAPTLALFGPTDPAQWAPVGPRIAVARSRDQTMAGLTTPEVMGAARALLSSPRLPCG